MNANCVCVCVNGLCMYDVCLYVFFFFVGNEAQLPIMNLRAIALYTAADDSDGDVFRSWKL